MAPVGDVCHWAPNLRVSHVCRARFRAALVSQSYIADIDWHDPAKTAPADRQRILTAPITGENALITDPGESENVGVDWRDPRADLLW